MLEPMENEKEKRTWKGKGKKGGLGGMLTL
jgi:hypothetical protein